jgi:hypothetical protein
MSETLRKIFIGLRDQPLTIALVIINLLFLGYVVQQVASAGQRRDQLISELARECIDRPGGKGDRQLKGDK